ncbi:aldo/keto reductase [Streptomyces kaniharaensis]|uniref:Aldo/keto reductase n=1 Tax=Streptomyces kaniharaensis TaxID=212423 RepID=A0A6N7KYP3_9ACTN|nr:aldo/keto reductase [Streptomyces kaniharaensis]MQS15679.1 aldo/keto reductase [Streptomyces kaniharaensis]
MTTRRTTTRRVGTLDVSAIGLGAMPLSVEGRPDEQRAIATVHAALDAGVTLIDTADSYHWHADEYGHNERLIARALAAYGPGADGVLIATKGGRGRPGDGSWTIDGDPAHLRRACEGSLRRLGVEAIGLYQQHHPDPRVPYEDSLGAIRELYEEGKIRAAGISNVSVEQVRQAREILGEALVSVQNRYSPTVLQHQRVLDLCTELGLAFLPWSPLGGIGRADGLGGASEAFAKVAAGHGVSPQRVALAWLLARSPVMLPIPGASRPETIRDSAAAAQLVLGTEELALLDSRTRS